MKIGLLENFQSPSEAPKHFITGAKAKRIVDELRVGVRLTADRVQLTVEHSWNVVKTWLASTKEQRERAEEKALEAHDRIAQMRAKIAFPSGAEFTFSRWPCADQRSFGIA